MFPGISTSEVLVVIVVILLIFGPKNIPVIVRQIRRWTGEARKAMADVKKEFNDINKNI